MLGRTDGGSTDADHVPHLPNLILSLSNFDLESDLAGAKVIKFGIESKWSSKETSTHRFRLAIIDAMRDMRRICEEGRVEDGATPTTSTSSAGGAKM